MNPRTCIVTRKAGDAGDLIRFVASPDGHVVPDLKGRLPGRGAWVTAERKILEKAIKKSAFSAALKADVAVSPQLADQVERLLLEQARQSLAMARKAGLVSGGFSKADAEIRSGKVALVVVATDAAEDGLRKVRNAVRATEEMGADPMPIFRVWPSAEMAQILGRDNVMHVVVRHGGTARNLKEKLARWQRFAGKEEEPKRPKASEKRS